MIGRLGSDPAVPPRIVTPVVCLRSHNDRSATIASRSSRSASLPTPPEPAAGRSLRALQGGRSRRRASDDIPVAQRSTALLPTRPGLLSRIGLAGLLVLLVGGAVVLVFPAPLRRWLAPLPVEGLNARLTTDGRLLGHFPYPEVSGSDLVEVSPGQALHRDAAAALLAMQRAAAADGISLTVLSAFRPVALQKELFFAVKSERNQSALQRSRVSAPPGFSEHSTGYAVDLGDGRVPQANLAESFAATQAFRWLEANAARYHFILSFPAGNPQGVNYEPWHWRFEGTAEALRQFEPAQRLVR